MVRNHTNNVFIDILIVPTTLTHITLPQIDECVADNGRRLRVSSCSTTGGVDWARTFKSRCILVIAHSPFQLEAVGEDEGVKGAMDLIGRDSRWRSLFAPSNSTVWLSIETWIGENDKMHDNESGLQCQSVKLRTEQRTSIKIKRRFEVILRARGKEAVATVPRRLSIRKKIVASF